MIDVFHRLLIICVASNHEYCQIYLALMWPAPSPPMIVLPLAPRHMENNSAFLPVSLTAPDICGSLTSAQISSPVAPSHTFTAQAAASCDTHGAAGRRNEWIVGHQQLGRAMDILGQVGFCGEATQSVRKPKLPYIYVHKPQ